MLRIISLIAVSLCSFPALAATPHTYGDTLIDGLIAAHKGIAAIEIRATAKDGSPIVLTRGVPHQHTAIDIVLNNSMGEPIGTMQIVQRGADHRQAGLVAYEASRRVYLANNLIEPDPFIPGAHRSRFGQRIIDVTMAANPDLVTLAMHVGSSGASNAILASNFGRIGKPGDKDDAKVIDGGATLKEPTNGGKRLAVSLPMLDRRGAVIGSLSTSFLVGPGGFDAASARAITVRDQIARQISSLSQLMR